MADDAVPVLSARRTAGATAAEVIAFDAEHPRMLLGPHRHSDLELMYYAEGTGRDRLGDAVFDVAAGDVLLVTPGIVHDARGLLGVRGWAVEFGAEVVAPVARPAADLPLGHLWWANPLLAPFVAAGQRPGYARFTVPAQDRPRWVHRFAELEREETERAPGWQEALAALLRLVLLDLGRLAAPSAAGLRSHGEVLLAQVFEVIDERFAGPLSTADVASAVGLTPGHLTTVVRLRTGRTVLEWIEERRMTAARHLLLTTDLSVEAVAGRVGYADPTYFNRRFRSYHGTAPGRWRASARGGAGMLGGRGVW